MKKIIAIWQILIAVVLVITAFEVRIWSMKNHFTHVDDFLAAAQISDMRNLKINDTTFSEQLNIKPESPVIDKLGVIGNLLSAPPIRLSFRVAMRTTFAPLQFIFSEYSIEYLHRIFGSIIVANRFPSFIFSVLTLLLFAFLLVKIKINLPNQANTNVIYPVFIFGTTIISLSWEHIIYAGHGSNYALSALIMVVLMLLLTTNPKNNFNWFFLSILLILAQLGSYQAIFALPAIIIALIYKQINTHNVSLFKLKLTAYLQILYVAIPNIIISLLLKKVFINSKGGLMWNVGPDREFLFQIPNVLGFVGKIEYIIHFFSYNTFVSIGSIVSNVPYFNVYWKVITLILITLAVIGFINAILIKDKLIKSLFVFTIAYLSTLLLLILFGQLTLSPTRHFLFNLPVFIFWTIMGALKISEWINRKYENVYLLFILLLSTIHISIFFIYHNNIRKERTNNVSVEKIIRLAQKYDVKAYVEGIFSQNISIDLNKIAPVSVNDFKTTPSKVLFFSTRNLEDIEVQNTDYKNKSKLIYSEKIKSDVEVDFFPLTNNGTNSLYIAIYQYTEN